MEKKLTHFDTKGNAVMVDVGGKMSQPVPLWRREKFG